MSQTPGSTQLLGGSGVAGFFPHSSDHFPSYRLRAFLVLSVLLGSANQLAAAPALGLGLAAIEETDERFRPAFWVEAIFGERWITKLESYGRRQAPVTQTSHLLSFSRQFPLFSTLLGSMGVALAYESTEVQREPDEERPKKSTNTNLGLALGLGWQSKSKVFVRAEWGSAIFPAGTAGILLSTSRKQSLGLGVGWRFK